MGRKLEFFFDYGSPTTYLAYTQIGRIVERTGATLVWKPMLLGGIFKATGNQSPAMVPAKGSHMGQDLARFAARYGVPLTFNPHFPINTLFMMRATYVAEDDKRLIDFIDMCFKSMWVEPKNMGDPEVIAQVFMAHGFDPDYYAQRTGEAAIKDKLKAVTEEAVARGVFGAPTFFVDTDEMFFGQDRLDFVEEALKA